MPVSPPRIRRIRIFLPAQEKLLREQAERNGYDLVKVFAIQESAAGKNPTKDFPRDDGTCDQSQDQHRLRGTPTA
jgi:hypothetical protein